MAMIKPLSLIAVADGSNAHTTLSGVKPILPGAFVTPSHHADRNATP
jgi:hypothetical protein